MQYPRKIIVEFQGGTCPLRCKKCYVFGEHVKGKVRVQKMPLENAKKLIDDIAQLNPVPAIQPFLATEPFANEDLREIIPYCTSKNVPLNIITSGVLLNDEWMDLLIAYLGRNSTISFSLDAVTEETYEKVRGGGLYSLAEVEKKIEYLIKYREIKGPRVTVSFTYDEDNYKEKDIFLNKWKNVVDAVRISCVVDSERKIPDFFRKKDKALDLNKKDICPYLEETIVIDSGGEVRICCMDVFGETYFGNVFEEGIMAIWNGEKMERIRRMHQGNRVPPTDFCYGCEEGYSGNNFKKIEETEDYLLKAADYAIYYNRKEKEEKQSGE